MPQWVLFQTGNMNFALDRDCISSIQPIPDDSMHPRSRILEQTIEDNGQDLKLIDLAAAMGQETPQPHSSDAELIVINKSPPYALLADNVQGAMEADGEQVNELPAIFADTARACFPNVLNLENQLALVIDADALWEVETVAAPIDESANELPNGIEDQELISDVEEIAPSGNSSEKPVAVTLEDRVGEKIQRIIEQRVHKMVVKTLARTLDHNFG